MFHQISWQTYLLAFAIVALLYYAIVLFLFFKKNIAKALNKIFLASSNGNKQPSESAHEGKRSSEDDYTTYQSLRDEMTAFLETSEPDTFKSDILFSLVSIIKKHPQIQDERFQEALNKEIRRIYLQKYNDSMEEEELSAIWQA